MTLQGKGYFVWKIRYTENGDVDAIGDLAAQADFTHVLVKVADGKYGYNFDPDSGEDLVGPFVQALRSRGIAVWGWVYTYGVDVINEADKAIERVNQFSLDGLAVDAEKEYKDPGMDDKARQYMSRLRSGLPDFPIALSSYRYPSYHPTFPWDEFMEKCNLNMPQVYWELNHNPAEQLERSVNEFRSMTYSRPIFPTGSAYKRSDWETTPEDVIEFMDKARELELSAANFWEWSHTRKYLPAVWDTISDYYWPTDVEEDISEKYIDALNSHNPDRVVALYVENAVHVTSERTIQGLEALRAWYETFFNEILPNGVFTLIDSIGVSTVRHLTWTATSTAGEVNNGSDTLGLRDDKISYHFTHFIIT